MEIAGTMSGSMENINKNIKKNNAGLMYIERIPDANTSGIRIVKAKAVISYYDYVMNAVDGDTQVFVVLDENGQSTNEIIKVRFIGVDAPEVQHYITKDDSKQPRNLSELQNMMVKVFKGKNGKYTNVDELDATYKKIYESESKTYELGTQAKEYVLKMLGLSDKLYSQSIYSYYKLTETLISDKVVTLVLDKTRMAVSDDNKLMLGTDDYGRHLGVVYIPFSDEKYINLNKTLLLQGFGVKPYASMPIAGTNSISEVFDTKSYYDLYGSVVGAAEYNDGKEIKGTTRDFPYDDRSTVHSKVYGDAIKNVTSDELLIIGDSMFIVPPESISILHNTSSVKVPVLRSSGMAVTNPTHNETLISVVLYFSGKAINGHKYTATLPNGEKVTYYMNGLRSLISQFKKCPLLPVQNYLLNVSNNIDFVSLDQINVTTVEGLPNVLKAEIIMTSIDQASYIYDLESNESIGDLYNWPLYRYYYQKSLIDENSKLYLKPISEDSNGNPKMDGKLVLKIAKQSDLENAKNMILNAQKIAQNQDKQQYYGGSPDKTLNPIDSSRIYADYYTSFKGYVEALYNAIFEYVKMNEFSDVIVTKTINTKYGPEEVSYIDKNKLTNSIANTILKNVININTANGKHNELCNYSIIHKSNNVSSGFISTNYSTAETYDNLLLGIPIYDYSLGVLKYKDDFILKNDDNYNKSDYYQIDSTGKNSYDVLFSQRIYKSSLDITSSSDIGWLGKVIGTIAKINVDFANILKSKLGIKDYSDVNISTPRNIVIGVNPSAVDLTKYGIDEHIYETIKTIFDVSSYNKTVAGTANNSIGNTEDVLKKIYDGYESYKNLLNLPNSERDLIQKDDDSIIVFTKAKDAIDDTLNNITYEDRNIDGFIIENISVGTRNIFNHFSLLSVNDKIAQYLGSTDAEIVIKGKVVGVDNVTTLKKIYDESLALARNYKDFLYTSILTVENEIINMFGISNVLFKSVSIETTKNFPNVFDVSIVLTSFDKTSRNRQELNKIYSSKAMKINDSSEISQNYIEMVEKLKDIEIYPDLDLPTYYELIDKGFNVENNGGRYVDPDFYVSYKGRKTFSMIIDTASDTVLDSSHVLRDNNLGLELSYKTNEIADIGIDNVKTKINGFDTSELKTIDDTYSSYISEIAKKAELESEIIRKNNSVNSSQETYTGSKFAINDIAYSAKIKNLDTSIVDTKYGNLKKIGISPVLLQSNKNTAEKAKSIIGARINDQINKNGLFLSDIHLKSIATGKKNVQGISKTYDLSAYLNKDWYIASAEEIHTYLEIMCDVYGVNPSNDAVIKSIIHSIIHIESTNRHFVQNDKVINISNENPNYPACAVINGKRYYVYTPSYYEYTLGRRSSIESPDRQAVGAGQINMKDIVAIANKQGGDAFTTAKKIVVNPFVNIEFAVRTLISKYFWLVLTGSGVAGTIVASENELNNSAPNISIDRARWLASAVHYLGAKNHADMFSSTDAAYGTVISSSSSKAPQNRGAKILFSFNAIKKYIDGTVEIGQAEATLASSVAAAQSQVTDGAIVLPDANGYVSFVLEPNNLYKGMFHDTIHYDKKGRLLRAFPTFLMILVDEGKKIFNWKFHDNFYGYNAIQEINIARSRKSVASTCTVTMVNTFNSHWRWKIESLYQREVTLADAVESFFNTGEYIEQTEKYRESEVRLSMLSPGARLHVRMGYGANAQNLPVKFNGTITEFENGDVATIVAMSDGVELLNKLPVGPKETLGNSSIEGEDPVSKFFDFALKKTKEPRDAIISLLTSKGSWLQTIINEKSSGKFFNDNPIGIVHFGDENFKDIFMNYGEIEQNIYAGYDDNAITIKTKDGDTSGIHAAIFDDDTSVFNIDETNISMMLFGKTAWDVISLCTMVVKDYIASVEPFEFRSTLFYGKPYYKMAYAYDYADFSIDKYKENIVVDTSTGDNSEDSDASSEATDSETRYEQYTGVGKSGIRELRKTYKQAHIFTSYTDIIKNEIKATENGVYTAVIGTYGGEGVFYKDGSSRTPIIFADTDIWPEKQKTALIDTSLFIKGIPFLGWLPFVNKVKSYWVDQKNAIQIASASLAEYMKDMYAGELMIIGYPAIKPRDYIYIWDDYNKISGIAEVKQVYDIMNVESGYITTIVPDAAVCQHDRMIKSSWCTVGTVATISTATIGGLILTQMAGKSMMPVLKAFQVVSGITMKYGVKVAKNTKDALKGAVNVTAKNIKNVKESMEAMADAAKASDEAKGLIKKFYDIIKGVIGNADNIADVNKIAKAADDAADAARVFSLSNPLTAILVALEICGEYMIERSIVQFIKNYIMTRQAVSMTVLKQYGFEMSAGINGHAGLVVGDAPSAYDKIIMKLFNNDFVKALYPDISETAESTFEQQFGASPAALVYEKLENLSPLPDLSTAKNNKTRFLIEMEKAFGALAQTFSNSELSTESNTENSSGDIVDISNPDIAKYIEEFKKNTREYDENGAIVAAYACTFEGCAYAWGASGQTARQYVIQEKAIVKRFNESGKQAKTESYLKSHPEFLDKPCFDCSGFVSYVYSKLNGKAYHQVVTGLANDANVGSKVSIDQLKIGDIVFYSNDSGGHHTAIYIGNGKVVEAPSSGKGVTIGGPLVRKGQKLYNYARRMNVSEQYVKKILAQSSSNKTYIDKFREEIKTYHENKEKEVNKQNESSAVKKSISSVDNPRLSGFGI